MLSHDKNDPKENDPDERDTIRRSSEGPAPEKRRSNDRPRVENLPLGTGYDIEHLPTDVIKPEIHPLNDPIPDLVKAQELDDEELTDEELPAPQDDYYDFDKDIYGDEAEIKPDL